MRAETRRQGDGKTRGQGDKGISRLVSLSPRLLVSLSLLLIPLVYFYPVLLGQITLAPGDGWAQNLPLRALLGQMIARGELPLWNPYIFAGMPLAASVYPGAFYPPNWLFAVLSPKWAMNVVVITTYHLALIGTYLYARRIGTTRTGALLAGTAFTFGGYLLNHLSHTSRIAAAAWLPWVLLAIENCRASCQLAQVSVSGHLSESRQAHQLPDNKLWRWTCLGALFIALQFLAGEPQMLVFTALVAAPCALLAVWQLENKTSRVRFVLALAVMLSCGALLMMIQLLPSLELLAQSERSDPGPVFFGTHSFPPWQLPALFFPYFFGGAMFPPYRVPNWGADMPAIMSGYVGLLTWLLALIAIFSLRRRRDVATTTPETKAAKIEHASVWLWAGLAVLAMVLAFGGYLPFKLNHLLYHVPGYKTFRGLYRHQFEFTFALGMLAGLGMTRLTRLPAPDRRRVLQTGTLVLTIIIIIVALLYLFGGDWLATQLPRPPQAASFTNAEFLIPIACFALTVAALWFYATQRSPSPLLPFSPSFLLLAVLLLDLAAYGHFFHWRTATFNVAQRLADPPAVQLIKARERDWHSFRVMSHPTLAYDYAANWPEDINFELINQPNISILRGLHSVSGYDVLRPVRTGELLGSAGSAIAGFVQDSNSFGLADRGLDLLNVKYLIVGHGSATGKQQGYTFDGVYFARTNFGKEFKPGVSLTTDTGGVTATELAIVSMMANSGNVSDGALVLRLRLHTRVGQVIERELQAGRDTSEWAYDRPDVKASVQHRRAPIAESTPAEGFDSHSYLGRLSFDRAEIEKIECTTQRRARPHRSPIYTCRRNVGASWIALIKSRSMKICAYYRARGSSMTL
jgi:hypothetical protein